MHRNTYKDKDTRQSRFQWRNDGRWGEEREMAMPIIMAAGSVHFQVFVVAHRSLRAALPPSLAVDQGRAPRGGARRAGGRVGLRRYCAETRLRKSRMQYRYGTRGASGTRPGPARALCPRP